MSNFQIGTLLYNIIAMPWAALPRACPYLSVLLPLQLMRANPALVSTQLYNDVLSAIARTGDMGALYTTYKEMIVHKVPANARTYHALLDCCLTSGKKHAGKGAAYYTWRNLVKEFPAIELDVGLLNKFVQCCLQCRDAERALFFLSVFDEGGMLPNVETFQMLLKVTI